jgi:hypothetical protein
LSFRLAIEGREDSAQGRTTTKKHSGPQMTQMAQIEAKTGS